MCVVVRRCIYHLRRSPLPSLACFPLARAGHCPAAGSLTCPLSPSTLIRQEFIPVLRPDSWMHAGHLTETSRYPHLVEHKIRDLMTTRTKRGTSLHHPFQGISCHLHIWCQICYILPISVRHRPLLSILNFFMSDLFNLE